MQIATLTAQTILGSFIRLKNSTFGGLTKQAFVKPHKNGWICDTKFRVFISYLQPLGTLLTLNI